MVEAVPGAGFGALGVAGLLFVGGGVLGLTWPVAETCVVSAMRRSIARSYEETYVLVCSTILVRVLKMILTILKKPSRKCSNTCLAECRNNVEIMCTNRWTELILC